MTPPSLDVRVYRHAERLDARWDSARPDLFFFDPDFLHVMESSGVEAAEYRFLLLEDGASPVGAAVLSRFTLRLDLLSGDPWVAKVRRWAPSLLDVPMVCCGIPASFGQHHLHVTDPRYLSAAVRAVHGEMSAWAEETGTAMLLWKEWSPAQGVPALAGQHGYVALPTLPDHLIDPLPASVDEFLGSLRSPYRRKYRRLLGTLPAFGGTGSGSACTMTYAPFGAEDVQPFFDGYEAVLRRTPVRLETYPADFFRRLAASPLDTRKLTLSLGDGGGSITALLIPSGDTLSFVLVAKLRARYPGALYPNLLRCIVLTAIGEGFRSLRLGQTSAYAKCAVGARPQRLETLILLRGAVPHRLLEQFGGLLFPETESPNLNVFLKDGPRTRFPFQGSE